VTITAGSDLADLLERYAVEGTCSSSGVTVHRGGAGDATVGSRARRGEVRAAGGS
jgi:hypothetical protein